MLNEVEKLVYEILGKDDSGHDMEHINRVLKLSLKFAEEEKVNKEVVGLIALLHDVDDYKLFGIENAEELVNAKIIMNKINICDDIQEQVLLALGRIGYSKSLKGIRPLTIEGMIVSDADMCDALGVNGVLRTYRYSIKNNRPFFDKNIFPIENISACEYANNSVSSGVCHMFEKILKLKDLMMTDSGRKETLKRHKIVVDILYNLFDEENALEWKSYLDNFLITNGVKNKIKKK